MRGSYRLMTAAVAGCLLAGCRTATHVVEEPRVDLELAEGSNRGYLVGTPPETSAPGKTTRQIVETEVEVPPTTRKGQPQSSLGEVAPPEVDMSEESSASEENMPMAEETFDFRRV